MTVRELVNILYAGTRYMTSLRIRHSSSSSIECIAPRTTITCMVDQLKRRSEAVGKFVSYPLDEFTTFIKPFAKPELVEQLSVFNDYSLMVRQQPLSILADLVKSRGLQIAPPTSSGEISLASCRVPRFLLYGQPGCGNSLALGQLAHYAGTRDWLVCALPNAEHWLDRCYDHTPCNDYHQQQFNDQLDGEPAFDFPSRSADWLQSFNSMNADFLNKFQPKLSREVNWTQLEKAPAGTPWTELIDFGIDRTKYSTDIIGILLREIRTLSSQPDGPPCMLIVDGVNFLWCRGTRIKDKTLQKKVTVDRLAIVHHVRRALCGDWLHGAILASVNPRAAWPTDREKSTPGYLLGQSGFTHLDPFIPVLMENYTAGEFNSQLRFYAEHKWLAVDSSESNKAELAFLSDCNPLEMDRLAAER